jgi:signal transduction histidine kinase/streptogramin lyase
VSGSARAQVVNFRHYTAADGVPQAQVLAIHQDRLGYLWFATYGGLARFNGVEFRTFTREDGLTSNSVFDVTEDGDGRLFIATSGGLCIRHAGAFRCRGERDGLVHDNARNVTVDAVGGAWVGTLRGLSYVGRDSLHNYTTADGLPDERIVRVVVDSLGAVWVATARGLARFINGRFEPDTAASLGARPVQFIASAGDGVLAGADGRLFLRRRDSVEEVAAGRLPDSTVFADGVIARDGTIWLATGDGGLRIGRDGRVDRLARANGLLSDLLLRVSLDREGNVWFGAENGASKHVPGPFRTYTVLEGLPNPFVRAIGRDARGRLWLGTRSGVAVREGDRFRPVPLAGVPDDRVYSVAADASGGMLIGTRRGLVRHSAGQIQVYRERDGLPGDVVYALAADGVGGVWIGTDRGLARWSDGRVTPVRHPQLDGVSFISMAQDSRGRLWLGRTSGGISVLDGDTVRELGPADGITDQTVWSLAEDAQGRIWAGTNGDGALIIADTGIQRLTTRDGLASNFVWQVLADSRGDVWLFGNLGLDRLSGERLTHYGRGSGLIELEGAANSAHEDAEGTLWFGTGAGVVRYARELETTSDVPPLIYIEELTQNGTTLAADAPPSARRFRNGTVRISFASPSFRDETAIRFRYRLAGSDTAWSAATPDRSITFAGLSPGRYRFEVVARQGNIQSSRPAAVDFVVLPTLWQTLWFRLTMLALLLGVTASVPALRARRLERERRRLEGLVAKHTRELAEKNARLEQSNRDLEHFAYVASHDLQEPLRKIQAFSDRVNSHYAERLDDRGRDYLSRMVNAAARMQNLIEALLSLSRVSTKRGQFEPIDLATLLTEVVGDLEMRLNSTHGRVVGGPLPAIEGDPVQIRQLLQNLIGNALKFHRADVPPVVRVSSARTPDGKVEIVVEDNGIGFESAEADRIFLPFLRLHGRSAYEGTGIGLTICQKIVERHGGTIRAESAPGRGSRFVFTLPRRDTAATAGTAGTSAEQVHQTPIGGQHAA